MKRIATFLAASLLAFSAFGQNTRINERPISDTIGNAIAGTCSTANAVLYNASTPCSANLTFSTSTNLLSAGTGSAGAMGMYIGYGQGSGTGGIWLTNVTPDTTNYLIRASSSAVLINTQLATGTIDFRRGNSVVLTVGGASGTGINVGAGTAADNTGRAATFTQSWTDGTSSNIGIVGNFDMGATGTATGKLLSLQAGAAGTTEVMSVAQDGTAVFGVGSVSAPAVSFGANTHGLFAFTSGQDVSIGGGGGSTLFVPPNSVRLNSVTSLQFSSTTAANGTADGGISRISAGVLGVGTGAAGSMAGTVALAGLQVHNGTSAKVADSGTAPTIASGFGSSPTVPANNGTSAFTINVGTGGTASAGVITMPAATTGWDCKVDYTGAPQAAARTLSAPTSTTSITLTNYTIATGAALAWTASQVLNVSCRGY